MSRREAAMSVHSSNEDDDDDLVEDLGAVQRASHPASHGAGPGSKIAEDDDQQDVEMLKRLQATRGSGKVSSKIEDRESEFQKRKFDRVADGVLAGTYEERMKAVEEEGKSQAQAQARAQGQATPSQADSSVSTKPGSQEDGSLGAKTQRKRRRRWDDPGPSAAPPASASNGATSATDAYLSSDMETARGTGSETEAGAGRKETSTRRRRWDATPEDVAQATAQNILNGAADGAAAQATAGAPQPLQTRWERDLAARNKELSDAELDKLLPTEGYIVVPPPHGYAPKNKGSRKLLAAPDQDEEGEGTFTLPEEGSASARAMEVQLGVAGGEEVVTADGTTLPPMRKEDMAFFSKLMDSADQTKLDPEEVKERKILALLLKIKNGLPSQRKAALRQITNKARVFGAKALFHQILPLLMSPSLEDQERHLLVKVVDRVLYRLDDLVRPYTQNILVVIEPMLIDTDYYARVEAREIIANLSKAAGLTTMLSTIRPDISNPDDYVRNATSRALAVVASALGVPAMLPFLKAVCQSRKSWQARHTGVKTVQQISILLGCSILPFLTELVSIVASGLNDQEQKVRTMTALALASLAESAHPYGIESFDPVLEPLWRGVRQHQGRTLAAFLKAIGNIIPLMYDDENASYFTKQVMAILIREFRSSEDEMRMIVLTVVKQCVSTDGVAASYVRSDVVPDFISAFWTRRSALDFRTYRQVVETTVELANKVGGAHVIEKLVTLLRDENEPLRRMTTECIMKVLENLGATDVNLDLEVQLIDGALFAFQEQAASILASAMATSADGAANNALGERESLVMLNGFATIVNALGIRVKPYLTQIASTIKFRLNNKDALVRGQAAELVARIANVMAVCGEDHLMAHLGVVLFESLGEEYPATLASVLAGLRGIVAVIGMKRMQPPVKDLIPRLTPILRNQNQKVQENTIDLIGRVADRGAEFVSAREWMRICFELIEMLRAKRKAIRRASASTFGYIAKAIGPSDILHVLLGNLRVQDRTMRVCTTVSLAIVAESCGPFTVLPALLNEYRVTDINVQNGCLKALSFVFEYIGEMSKDYIYSTVTLLEDALTDKDAVHRQTACTVVKHLALGVQGAGCEDALTHLLNFVWPNIFETSPHVIGAVLSAIEGIRVSLGPQRVMMYVLQGLFHPARKVREVFWKVYNNLYVYSGHAIVPSYPRLDDDYVIQVDPSTPSLDAKKLALKKVLLDDAGPRKVRNSYRRTHLELFL